MIQFAFLDTENLVIAAGSNTLIPGGAVALPGEVTAEVAMRMMLLDGQFVQRPTLTEPELGVRQARFTGLPLGTTAVIDDILTGYQMATLPEVNGVIEIELPDLGLYRIEVTPPRPWLPMTLQIEVP